MHAYVIDWASLLLRWLHLITGIAWIGSSFYFVWLDNSLKPPQDPELQRKGVSGELWAVHGGGFYNPQKYLVAPATLPAELHWFKWESYSTWITGFLLISTLYYSQAATWMIDPARAAISPGMAVALGLATLAGGWLVYDLLCRLLLERSQLLFGAIYYVFVVAVAFLLTQLLSGRAAFIHVGAMIATTMSGNVFFWIIPGQKKTIAQMQRGEAPDPIHGKRAKQRSVHNNYLTLPVLFCMISNHYAFTYGHP
ncbi:MAG: urate hydroxylase PuuD, partial [Rhodocyclaceae bacterium]|nr:urate hydroxylase PuuD [Rhodocyclaceae bacterium]